MVTTYLVLCLSTSVWAEANSPCEPAHPTYNMQAGLTRLPAALIAPLIAAGSLSAGSHRSTRAVFWR